MVSIPLKFALAALLALLACDALAESELAIVVAVPESIERTDWFFDVCEDEPCLAHGYDIILVDLKVTDVLLGPIAKGRMKVRATNRFLFHSHWYPLSRDNRHLFVLRQLSDDDVARFAAAEADPFVAREACTVFPIEDYLSDALWMSIEVPFFEAENCYTRDRIRKLVDRRDS